MTDQPNTEALVMNATDTFVMTSEALAAALPQTRIETSAIVLEGTTAELHRFVSLPPAPTTVVVARSVDDCTGAHDCPGPHIDGCFAQTPESADYAREHYTPAPPTQADLLGLVDDLITAAGEHRNARLDEAAARRDLHTATLTDAIAQSRKALAAEQTAAAALRAAITTAVPA